METENNIQELVEQALEMAIDTLDLVATDDNLNKRLREAQDQCNRALMEIRGFGHEAANEEWQN